MGKDLEWTGWIGNGVNRWLLICRSSPRPVFYSVSVTAQLTLYTYPLSLSLYIYTPTTYTSPTILRYSHQFLYFHRPHTYLHHAEYVYYYEFNRLAQC